MDSIGQGLEKKLGLKQAGLGIFILRSLLMVVGVCGCAHSIDFRSNHFASPVVSDKQWGGHAAAVGGGVTRVTLSNDTTTNPPTRDKVSINEDVNVTDFLLLNLVSFDASLNVLNGVDLFVDGVYSGVRYQFLNAGAGNDLWVGALHGGYANYTKTTTQSSSASSEVKTMAEVTSSQAGLSLGYKFANVVPYFSYILEEHSVSSKVQNSYGSFGPYIDGGKHYYYSLGFSSFEPGLKYAVEISLIDIYWQRSEHRQQTSSAFKLGYQW